MRKIKVKLKSVYEQICDLKERDFPELNFVPVREDVYPTNDSDYYVIRIAVHLSRSNIYFVDETENMNSKNFYQLNGDQPTFLKQEDVYKRIPKLPPIKCFHRHQICKKPLDHNECEERI